METMTKETGVGLFGSAPRVTASVSGAMVMAREAQEVQAAMIMAKHDPRDEVKAWNRIAQACRRQTLAESACYAYPKGGVTVTGPSIRLAEVLARAWGNLDCGVKELEQIDGESKVLAYAWDLETNTRFSKHFTVKHQRRVGRENRDLDDPREIYEAFANQAARRLRACILAIIPSDVVEAAVKECENTMAAGAKEPLIDRIKKMVAAFAGCDTPVSQEMIEARLNHKIGVTTETELVQLRKIFVSIRDGMSAREDWFKEPVSKPQFPAEAGADEFKPQKPTKQAKTTNPPQSPTNPPESPTNPTQSSTNGPESSTLPPEPRTAPAASKLMKGVNALLAIAQKSEADLLKWLRNAEKIDPSLSSLQEVEAVTPSALTFVCDNWKTIAKAL